MLGPSSILCFDRSRNCVEHLDAKWRCILRVREPDVHRHVELFAQMREQSRLKQRALSQSGPTVQHGDALASDKSQKILDFPRASAEIRGILFSKCYQSRPGMLGIHQNLVSRYGCKSACHRPSLRAR
jgi:hypothetical protein